MMVFSLSIILAMALFLCVTALEHSLQFINRLTLIDSLRLGVKQYYGGTFCPVSSFVIEHLSGS